jgi:surface antigen/LysM repeat protein
MAIAPNVASLAVSAQIKSQFDQSSNATISKPQIIQPAGTNRTVTTYVTVAGDTVGSVAAKFNISTDTVKWANNLTSDALAVGTSLKILPENGVLYTVKSGDTTQSIAEKYGVDQSRIILYNDLDLSGLTPGAQIILPAGQLPSNERPGYVEPVKYNYTTFFAGYGNGFGGNTWFIKVGTPMHAGNTYAFGNCTAYAYDRRVELGLPVSSHWGNASSWAYAAQMDGLSVNHTPSVGAVMQNGGGFGHVAIVERILLNGDVEVSEMNASVSGGGFNIVSGRTISGSVAGQYLYIH